MSTDILTDQKAIFPEGRFRLTRAEAIKYAARLRDEWTVLRPLPGFKDWLSERIFDAEDRLKFSAMFFAIPKMMELKKTYTDIDYVDAWAGPNQWDVFWSLATICCKTATPCEEHRLRPNPSVYS